MEQDKSLTLGENREVTMSAIAPLIPLYCSVTSCDNRAIRDAELDSKVDTEIAI